MVGILSNGVASRVGYNIANANLKAIASIFRLSSGNQIYRAGDDVAALSIGTNLATALTTYNSALTNSQQATSLLGVADGGLSEISSIVARQKALAVQASSGALTDIERALLDIEFQDLSAEIDRIAGNTQFNGKNLIDGSLSDTSTITTKASTSNSTQAKGVAILGAALANTETIDINGVTFTGVTAGGASPLLEINVTTFSTATTQIAQLKNQIDQIVSYSGTDAATLTAKQALAELDIQNTANGELTITYNSGGTVGNSVVVQSSIAAANFTLDSANAGGNAGLTLGSAGQIAVDGDLEAGTFGSTTTFTGTATTVATGTVGDSLVKPLTTTVQATTGVDLSNISNNEGFTGTISGFTATYNAADIVDVTVTVGSKVYRALAVDTTPAADTIVTFKGDTAGSGSFKLQLASGAGSSVSDQTDANNFAARLDKALSTVEVRQTRNVSSFTAAGLVFPTGSGTASGDLSGSSFTFTNQDFTDVQVQDIQVTYSAASNAVIEFTIDGEIYRSGYNYDGSTAALGNQITAASGSGPGNKIGFVSITDPDNILAWDYTSTTNLDISTQAEAEGLEVALKSAFGVGAAGGPTNGTKFQVGLASSNTINVNIGSAKIANLHTNTAGASQTLSIGTQSGAQTADTVLTNSINRLNTIRAEVGASQQRFSYATANLQTTISNVDAARGGYLDTDIISESSSLAKSVLLTSIGASVLAQANQLSSSMLKLLEK